MPREKRLSVYSTERGDLRKHKPITTRQPASIPPQQQTAYLHRQTKGRGGKTVTLVKNLQLSEKDLKSLAKTLKNACGSGGTIKDGVIEVQGDHRPRIAETLQAAGYKVKIAGG